MDDGTVYRNSTFSHDDPFDNGFIIERVTVTCEDPSAPGLAAEVTQAVYGAIPDLKCLVIRRGPVPYPLRERRAELTAVYDESADRLIIPGRNGTAYHTEPARPEAPARPLPAGWTERPAVELLDDSTALVLGKRKRLRNRKQAHLLRELLAAGPNGIEYNRISLDAKRGGTGLGGARSIINGLMKDADFAAAIGTPGGKGKGTFRIKTLIEVTESA